MNKTNTVKKLFASAFSFDTAKSYILQNFGLELDEK